MTIWGLIIIIAGILAATIAFVWVAVQLQGGNAHSKGNKVADDYTEMAVTEVEHIFNDEFREELRNRGRLHFEKVIGENAMFLQQDLRLTTSQLNEFMKTEITTKLQEEFAKYEQSIDDAKQLATQSIVKTQEAIDEQRKSLSQQLMQELTEEKARIIKHFEENMADIIRYYLLAAVGDSIDLDEQLNYIVSSLEANKQSIIQDINDGA
jgi:parvulin-like peptidyl-prolyl isomerase